ncbi:MAG: TIGR03943 family protein [Chthoniobacter sp.]|uniref:TIGR03943 family putative permease subunit n=1 Tax=Chthoniobacter sp. TaxID=2510640 RepID=UPI0032A77767
MNAAFRRWLPCATLATWSAILLTFCASGRMKALLTPDFRVGAVIAGIVMGLMALVFLLFPADANCCSSAECGHAFFRRSTGKVVTFLILLLPITTAAMFSPSGYSGNVVKNRMAITDASQLGFNPRSGQSKPMEMPLPTKDPNTTPAPDTAQAAPTPQSAPPSPTPAQAQTSAQPPAPQDYLQRTPDGHIVAEVLDLLYAAQDNALRKDFEGKPVELIGQLMPDATNNASGKRFKAVRMFMTCCAADARPVAVLAEGESKVTLPEMSWIKITGTATFPVENGKRIAVLKAERVEKCNPPEETMLY